MARRQVTIFINGQEVAGSIKNIQREMNVLNKFLRENTEEAEGYSAAVKRYKELNGIVQEHRKELGTIPKALDETGNSWKTLLGQAGKFASVAGIAFTADAILEYGNELFSTGVKMDTLGRKADTVLGPSLGYVTAQARDNAEAMGLTNAEYVAAVTNIADVLIPMGLQRKEASELGVTIENLSGALAEWSGGQFKTEEVTNSLKKALLGEREELERYGVSIKQSEVNNALAAKGLEKLTGSSRQQAEAMETLRLITEKSTDAQRQYAENSDSAIRQQAKLEASIQNITEKLSVLLLPIFARLAEDVAAVVGVTNDLVDGFDAMVNPAKSLTQAFDDQASRVGELNKELPGLLSRYEELTGKTSLTKDEQDELAKVIQRVGELTPVAITQVDEYGRVLGINAGKSREFLEAEQARLAFVNKEAIAALDAQIAKLKQQSEFNQLLINQGKEQVFSGGGGGGTVSTVKLSADRIAELRGQLAKLASEIKGADAELKRLRGETPAAQDAAVPAGNRDAEIKAEADRQKQADKAEKEAEKAANKRQRQAEQEVEQEKNKAEKLLEIIARFKTEARLVNLEENERRLEEIRLEYQQEIDLAIELEQSKNKAVVESATASRIELERLQYEAIQAERDKIAEEETAALLENLLAQNEAQLAQEETFRQERAEIARELKEYADEALLTDTELELQRLEEQGAQLLALAESQGLDTVRLKEAFEARKAEIDKKAKSEEISRDKKSLEQKAAIQAATLGLLTDLSSGISAVAGDSEALQKATFAFNKGLAIAEVVINLQRELATINATYAAAAPVAITLSTLARVRAGISLATIAATAVQGAQQRKDGGYARVRGAQDGRIYSAQLIGQPTTGLLDYGNPVLMPSGILANEIGREYYVNHRDLENPVVANYVRAIENVVSHRQMAAGGFAPAVESVPAPATAETSSELRTMIGSLIGLIDMLMRQGAHVQLDDNTLIAIQKRMNQLARASGGRAT